jgi:hypothetical protein
MQVPWYDSKCSELTDIRITIRTIRANHASLGLSEDEIFEMLKRLNEREKQLYSELSIAFTAFTSHMMLKDLFAAFVNETTEAQHLMNQGRLFSNEEQGFLNSYAQRLLRMHLYLSESGQDVVASVANSGLANANQEIGLQ